MLLGAASKVEEFIRKSIWNGQKWFYGGTFLSGTHANITHFIDIDICQKSSTKSLVQTEATDRKGEGSWLFAPTLEMQRERVLNGWPRIQYFYWNSVLAKALRKASPLLPSICGLWMGKTISSGDFFFFLYAVHWKQLSALSMTFESSHIKNLFEYTLVKYLIKS